MWKFLHAKTENRTMNLFISLLGLLLCGLSCETVKTLGKKAILITISSSCVATQCLLPTKLIRFFNEIPRKILQPHEYWHWDEFVLSCLSDLSQDWRQKHLINEKLNLLNKFICNMWHVWKSWQRERDGVTYRNKLNAVIK